MIPVYNHEHAIGDVVRQVIALEFPCVLVDDGSSPECAAVLDALAAQYPRQVALVRHTRNQGKGAAVMTGFSYAAEHGYSHLLQVDADGQHCVADIPRFFELAASRPQAVIIGHPLYDESVPALRLYARYLTHVWVWINTLSFAIRDSMCGFRVYPVKEVQVLLARHNVGKRMNFDTEVIVRLYWAGVPMVNQATRVSYPSDGVSHFRAFHDNMLITRMHTVLFFGMLRRLPQLLFRKWRTR